MSYGFACIFANKLSIIAFECEPLLHDDKETDVPPIDIENGEK